MNTCHYCHQEIVHQNGGDQFVRVQPELRHGDGPITDMNLVPELTGHLDFCNLTCLCRWAAKQKSPFTGRSYSDA